MKPSRHFLIISILSLGIALPQVAGAHPSWHDHGPGYEGPPPPHMSRHHRGHSGDYDCLFGDHGSHKALSEEQRESLRDIRDELKPEFRDLAGQLRDNGEAMRRAFHDDGYGEEFERLAGKQGELIGEMIALRAKMESRFHEVLGEDYSLLEQRRDDAWRGYRSYGYRY